MRNTVNQEQSLHKKKRNTGDLIRYNLYRISYTQVMVRLAYDGNQFHNVFLREYSKWQLTKPNNLFGIGMIFSLNFSLMNFYQLKYAAEK